MFSTSGQRCSEEVAGMQLLRSRSQGAPQSSPPSTCRCCNSQMILALMQAPVTAAEEKGSTACYQLSCYIAWSAVLLPITSFDKCPHRGSEDHLRIAVACGGGKSGCLLAWWRDGGYASVQRCSPSPSATLLGTHMGCREIRWELQNSLVEMGANRRLAPPQTPNYVEMPLPLAQIFNPTCLHQASDLDTRAPLENVS